MVNEENHLTQPASVPRHRAWYTASLCVSVGFVGMFGIGPLAWASEPEVLPQAADVVMLHGQVYTGGEATQSAIAIRHGNIVAVGSDAQVKSWIGPHTRQIDLAGHWLLPGFNDAHVHLLSGGLELGRVDLHDARSITDLQQRLASQAKRTPMGQWIQGSGWDETLFAPVRWPTRADLDAVVADRPVVLERTDGHAAVVNSVALQLLHIGRHSISPPGGVIELDAKGEPTGVLKDAAMNPLSTTIPRLDQTGRLNALLAGMRYAASLGVTSVQDMSSGHIDDDAATARALAKLDQQQRMPIRVYMAIALHSLASAEHAQALATLKLKSSPYLHIGGFKAFADGSAGSRTAFFHAGYADRPSERGLLGEDMQDLNVFDQWLKEAAAKQLQVCTHAIGDAANDAVLDAYATVLDGTRDRRFRIEHAQHLSESIIARMSQLNVIASVQPYQGIDDGRWVGARVGPQRLYWSYPWASLLKAHVRLAFGTDWPVVPLDPWLGIYAATVRVPLDGSHPEGWDDTQKISLTAALNAYTEGSAVAEFADSHKGRIAVGQWADVVEWQNGVFERPLVELKHNQVRRTWVGGRLVYQAGDLSVATATP
jgi:predicted amidohydrolase YtcJ